MWTKDDYYKTYFSRGHSARCWHLRAGSVHLEPQVMRLLPHPHLPSLSIAHPPPSVGIMRSDHEDHQDHEECMCKQSGQPLVIVHTLWGIQLDDLHPSFLPAGAVPLQEDVCQLSLFLPGWQRSLQ